VTKDERNSQNFENGEEKWDTTLGKFLLAIIQSSFCNLFVGDPGGYWWPPTNSTWTHTIVSFIFSVSLIVAQFTTFSSFSGPELPEPF
jgi:hypothetical protein